MHEVFLRRIFITTVGSRGDVQPFVALALALQAAGHPVTLAAPENFGEWIRGHGIAFAPIHVDIMAILDTPEAREMMRGGTNPITFLRSFKAMGERVVDVWARDVIAASEDAGLVIHNYVSWATGQGVAHLKGIPAINVHLQPLVTSHDFPAPFLPWRHDLPKWVHAASWWLFEAAQWNFLRSAINQMRAQHFGCEPIGLKSPNRPGGLLTYPTLHAYSPVIIPKPGDWGAHHHVTGYWAMPVASDWHPAPALERFLAAGPAPVYIGFGSMAVPEPEKELHMLIAAARSAGVRAVIGAGWSGIGQADVPANFFVLPEAPHEWLFPRMAAVIHHGGAGTTAAALRAGVPQMVCPFLADQPFWGHRLQRMGVGPKAIYHRNLDAGNLAQSIRDLVGRPAYREKAAAAGRTVRAEDGLARAVKLIQAALKEPATL